MFQFSVLRNLRFCFQFYKTFSVFALVYHLFQFYKRVFMVQFLVLQKVFRFLILVLQNNFHVFWFQKIFTKSFHVSVFSFTKCLSRFDLCCKQKFSYFYIYKKSYLFLVVHFFKVLLLVLQKSFLLTQKFVVLLKSLF